MDFSEVITQVVILFIITFVGYYLRRINIITDEGIGNFSSLIFYVTMPGMILGSIASTSLDSAGELGQVIIASVISYSVFLGTAMIIPRLLKVEEGSIGLYRFMTIFANVGFVGFPLLKAILGESTVFLGAVFNIPFNILLFTIGIYFIVSDKGHGEKVKFTLKQFLNPGMVATIVGLTVMLVGIQLPGIILDTASTLGAVTTPVAMIVVGASLYGVDIGQMVRNRRVLALSAIRMVLFPLVLGLLLKALGISSMVVAVAMILAGMPIGTNTVIIARQYEGNVLDASEAVFMSTALMLFTVPLLVYMIQMIAL